MIKISCIEYIYILSKYWEVKQHFKKNSNKRRGFAATDPCTNEHSDRMCSVSAPRMIKTGPPLPNWQRKEQLLTLGDCIIPCLSSFQDRHFLIIRPYNHV